MRVELRQIHKSFGPVLANDADAWVQELESLTLEGLRVAIEEAESQVRSGEIQPMGPSLP